MRIIRGTHRGRRILAPANLPVRPTTDLAKESLFNILDNYFYFDEVKVLDLYSGTGNIAYEFASRESPLVVAVEVHPRCARFISGMATKLEFSKLNVVRTTAEGFLKHTSQQFDIIFADPPYDLDEIDMVPRLVFERNLLTEDGWLVIEHGSGRSFEQFPQLFDSRRYGHVHFSFFSNKKD